MNAMVEKVARAIGEKAVDEEIKWTLEWPHLMDHDSNAMVDLRDLARAAVEALREPSAEMLARGANASAIAEGWHPATPGSKRIVQAGWKAMIDAALAEEGADA